MILSFNFIAVFALYQFWTQTIWFNRSIRTQSINYTQSKRNVTICLESAMDFVPFEWLTRFVCGYNNSLDDNMQSAETRVSASTPHVNEMSDSNFHFNRYQIYEI